MALPQVLYTTRAVDLEYGNDSGQISLHFLFVSGQLHSSWKRMTLCTYKEAKTEFKYILPTGILQRWFVASAFDFTELIKTNKILERDWLSPARFKH